MRDIWYVIKIATFAILGLVVMSYIVHPVHAENNSSVVIKYYNGDYGEPSDESPVCIEQGATVYLNSSVDISCSVPPYPQLAYWNGYDMYDTNPTYNITLPDNKKGYYNFYVDPAIFETRLGNWYKYDGVYEERGWNLAFVVASPQWYNRTMRYQNGTLANLSNIISPIETDRLVIGEISPIPEKHVSDYLVARGDSFNITLNQSTHIWMFGRADQLMDYKSVNNTIDISSDILNGFEPGRYTIMIQTIKNGSSDFTVRYNQNRNAIQWFDPSLFEVESISLEGMSPQVIEEKLSMLTSGVQDDFTKYNFELQEPEIQIISIEEKWNPNQTVDQTGELRYNTNTSFIEVIGYTNVAPGSTLKFILDEDQQTPRTLKSHTAIVTAQGNYGGNMRWFRAYVPFAKYDLPKGEHSVTGYTMLSKSGTTAYVTLYEAPEGTYVPQKTVKYVSGRYGPEEFVPLPTPIVVEKPVPVPGPVQTVVVHDTPSPEALNEAQMKAVNEKVNSILITIGEAVAGILFIYVVGRFVYRVWARRKWYKE